jgi:hypothetical protein
MHSINVHIDETLNNVDISGLRHRLFEDPFVRNVELRQEKPHDLLVEFDPKHDVPLHVLSMLKEQGLHADIVGC